MRLLVGPPGSGKTTSILNEARTWIDRGDGGFRLVVPSSTMAEHLRNGLARDGMVVRPSTIVTLSGLVASLTPELEEASGEDLALIVEECLAIRKPDEFSALQQTPGLARTIAQNIEDLANSGCGPLEWTALGQMGVWRGRVLSAFGGVWDEVERVLTDRRLFLRARRIMLATAAVRRGNLDLPIRLVLVDGFFTFSRVEIELLQALDRRLDLVVTLPDWPGAAAVRQLLERQRCQVVQHRAVRKQPERTLIAAVDAQREVEEVVLRVLDARQDGFNWRDIGIVMRSAQMYGPLIERVFARAGIPARHYFGQPLAATTVFRFISDWVNALLSGWEHRLTMKALRSAAHEAGTLPAAAAFERVVVESLPGAGLDTLAGLAGRISEPGVDQLLKTIGRWEPYSEWGRESLPPAEWARRLAELGLQVSAPSPDLGGSREQMEMARLRAGALRSVKQALESTARFLPEGPIPLDSFWRTAHRALSAVSVRPRDGRRDVVHVMDVHEARQWELPVVFVCGLVEGEFPRRVSSDPLLGDDLRFRLQQQGFPVLTSKDRDREETFLCESAQTRATSRLTLSYPLFAAGGTPSLRSFVLDTLRTEPIPARPMRIAPAMPVTPPTRYNLQDERILNAIRTMNASFKPTSLEDYLQCPFRFFARRTLRLRESPAAPEDRLSPLTLGTVIHEAIDRWHKGGTQADLLMILEGEWRRSLAELRIPPSWRTETQWLLLARSARFYAVKGLPEPGWQVTTEMELSVKAGDFRFEGRADRVDRDRLGQAKVLEFKFVGSAGLRKRKGKVDEGLSVQAPLYALALEQRGLLPIAYSIVGLRGDTEMVTYDEPEQVRAGMEFAATRAESAAFQITQGDIRVMPADTEVCGYCSYQDACRKREEAVMPAQAV